MTSPHINFQLHCNCMRLPCYTLFTNDLNVVMWCTTVSFTEIHCHAVHLFKSIPTEPSLPRHTRINTNYQSHTWANLSSSVTFYIGICHSPVICMIRKAIMKSTAKCNCEFHARCSSHKQPVWHRRIMGLTCKHSKQEGRANSRGW